MAAHRNLLHGACCNLCASAESTLLVNDDTLATGVTVGTEWRFKVRVRERVWAWPAWVLLRAMQRDGLRTLEDMAFVRVTSRL